MVIFNWYLLLVFHVLFCFFPLSLDAGLLLIFFSLKLTFESDCLFAEKKA